MNGFKAHTAYWLWNKTRQRYTNRCGYRTAGMARCAAQTKYKHDETQIHKQVGIEHPYGRPVYAVMGSE